QRVADHLPCPAAHPEWLGVERADRAQVDDVTGKLVIDTLFDERRNAHVLATTDRAEFLNARDFRTEAHATRAVNAAGHVGRNQRTDVLVLHDALLFRVARHVAAVTHREILQLAFAALIAHRAIER